jgi:hypothetical protein
VHRLALVLFLMALAGSASAAPGDSEPKSEDTLCACRMRGLRVELKMGAAYGFVPKGVQDVSFVFSNHVGWGIPSGPILFSPGISIPAWLFEDTAIGFLGEVEAHVPFWHVSPYLVLGGGGALAFLVPRDANHKAVPGGVTYVDGGGAFRAGGGLTVFPMSWIGIGMQATYAHVRDLDLVEVTWPVELRF